MIESNSPTRHDFDHWEALSRLNPELFETERSRVIEDAIRNAPIHKQHRLRCLQWKLDQIRKTSSTPMVASLLINRLLWEKVVGKNGLLEQLNTLQTPGRHQQIPPDSAEIIPFPD